MPHDRRDRAYYRNHEKVSRVRGRAREQMCVEGGDHPARDWAHIHDTDPTDVMSYQPMCVKHHQVYDGKMNAEERAKVSSGVARYHASLTPEQKADRARKISEAKKGKPRPDMIGNQLARKR